MVVDVIAVALPGNAELPRARSLAGPLRLLRCRVIKPPGLALLKANHVPLKACVDGIEKGFSNIYSMN